MKINILHTDFVEVEQRFVVVEGNGIVYTTKTKGSAGAGMFEVVSTGDLNGKVVLAFQGSVVVHDVGSKMVVLLNKKDILAECIAAEGERIVTPTDDIFKSNKVK